MSQAALLKERRFAPFFWTQFFGAFNDNLFKQSIVLVFTAAAPPDLPLSLSMLSNLASGLFILPYFLFSATAGQLAERLEKSSLMQRTKLFELALMIAAAVAFQANSGILMLVLLTLLGVQATLFGPVKFAILPTVLKEEELVGGNGLVEMGTYVAILLGTILAGVLLTVGGPVGREVVSGALVVFAIAGYLASRMIPKVPAKVPDLKIDPNIFASTWRVIGYAREVRSVWLSVLGNSWFWFYGALVLAQFPGFVHGTLHGREDVITLLLFFFSVGVGAGSLLCERLSSGHIELGLVPFGSIGMTLFGIDLFFASEWYVSPVAAGATMSAMDVLRDPHAYRIMVDIVLLGAFGGFYSVPLNALIQHRSDPAKRSRIIAANNVLNAIFMVAAAGVAVLALDVVGLSIPQLFLVAAILNALVAIYIYTVVPEFLLRFLTWMLMSVMYRLRARGLDRIPDEGAAVLACNHVSYVDALILTATCRRPVRWVMWWRIYEIPFLHWMFRTARAIPIGGRKEKPGLAEKALEEVDKALAEGELVGIFPEGMLTYTGEINTFRPGIEKIVEKRPVPVIPMALRGLWGSWFSRRGGPAMKKRPRRFRSKIELEVGEPIAPEALDVERLQATVSQLRGAMR